MKYPFFNLPSCYLTKEIEKRNLKEGGGNISECLETLEKNNLNTLIIADEFD